MWLLPERSRSLELQERGACAEQAYVSSGRGRPGGSKTGQSESSVGETGNGHELVLNENVELLLLVNYL